jgi:hypothetical protein
MIAYLHFPTVSCTVHFTVTEHLVSFKYVIMKEVSLELDVEAPHRGRQPPVSLVESFNASCIS